MTAAAAETAPPPPLVRRALGAAVRTLGRVAFVVSAAWCAGAIWYSGLGPGALRGAAAAAFALAFPVAWYARPQRRRATAAVFAAAALAVVVAWQAKRPRPDRDWAPEVAVLPEAEFDGDTVRVRNVRNCLYHSATDFDVRRYDATYDLRTLDTVDFLVEPFSSFRGPAHTMLSFGFADGRHLAVSVEVRRERGEEYGPLPGLFRRFELTYVVGDEEDLIRLRTDHRRDVVYLYPVRATRDAARRLLEGLLRRANELRERAEFYNTLTSTCTTNLADHVNRVTDGPSPFHWKVLLPAFADELALDRGLLDTDLPLDAARRAFRIDEIARADDGTPFSARIRRARR